MLIAVDIGNSRIKAGIFRDNKLSGILSFIDTPDALNFIRNNIVNDFAVSSVVPDKTKIIADEVKSLTGKEIFVITKETKTNLKISYKTPETLGTDRLCSAEGAFFLYKNSEKFKRFNNGTYILAIDFGTATTVNIVEYPGKFIGGLIAPGIDMMFGSLEQRTALLPHLSVSDFTIPVGNDTNSSIASGVVTSVVGMIEKIINYLRSEKTANEVLVYITGGNAEKLIPFLNFDFTYEEGLVLYGINTLWELNKSH